MIAYDLQCTVGHRFEGWFEDAAAYETQRETGMIACPICNRTDVTKIPSTFGIKATSSASSKPGESENQAAIELLARRLADYVEKNFDNVGCDFAKEALKIHYGAAEPRNIRGCSTEEEEKTLKEEGVNFIKLPIASHRETDS